MKFGQNLKDSLWPEWRFYYIDYDGLKKLLKDRTAKGSFTEDDEAAFVEALERELEKVAAFRNIKGDELSRRIQHCESVVESITKGNPAGGSNMSGSNVNLFMADGSLLSRFESLEQECNRIIVELTELSKYVRMNYSGFLKILKKHDKHTSFMLKPMFMVRLNQRPFYKQTFDKHILRISKLYDIVRTGGQPSRPVEADPNAGSQQFVRKTTKYWVHPDNVTELKCIILKYLPVLVFNSKGGKEYNPAITSVYFDNDAFELYLGRIEKKEGAEAVRFRWYGDVDNQEIFIERKTHREDWTGEKSVKQRFSIKEKYVNEYMTGAYSMEKAIRKMRERGTKSEKELEELDTLSSEIQSTIVTKELKPMVRTFYNRTAFQLPGDARVRISLDTELCMIREDNFDKMRSGSNWRRSDVGTDFPFNYLPEEDICRFPYAVLEVKLQTQLGTESPQWVQDLVKSHLVEEVPKFSKFIHGVSTLLENRVALLPFWLPQMDKDIRKPFRSTPLLTAETNYAESLYGGSNNGRTTSPTSSATAANLSITAKGKRKMKSDIDIIVDSGHSLRGPKNNSNLSNGYTSRDRDREDEYDENAPLLDEDEDEDEISSRSTSGRRHKKNSRGRTLALPSFREFGNLFRGKNGHWSFRGLSPSSATSSTMAPQTAQDFARLAAQQNKRIALPVRVEPKVFFANERTFLQWLHFTITLGGLALGLLNFGDPAAQIAGLIFTVIAMIFMIYSTFLFHWRAQMIRNKNPGPYDDRVGPTVLVAVIFFAVLINFWLKFK